MRVAAQVQAEMPDIAGPVFRLRLGAQDHLVQDLLVLGADRLRQDRLNWLGRLKLVFGALMSRLARNSLSATSFSDEGAS